MNRRLLFILTLGALMMLSAGCSSATPPPITENPQGFWDTFLVFPLHWLIVESSTLLGNNYGLGILVATIIIRFLVLPLTIKQLKSSKRMQELNPEFQKIREKYKNDPQKAQQETLLLMQKHNVNPLAGCLPLLVQMPILFAFYHAIIRSPEIPGSTFLGMPLGSHPGEIGWYAYILPFLAALTTYLQSKVMGSTSQGNPQMQMMFVFLPIMIFVVAISLPIALSLYWFYGNVFTIVQSYFLYRDSRTNTELKPKGGTAK